MKFLDRQGVSYCCKTTNDDDGITNSLEIFEKPRYFIFRRQIGYSVYEETKCMDLNVMAFVARFFVVVLCTSLRQTMIVDLETLTWKNFEYATTSILLGL
jgi:hypothetical protein